MPFGTISVILTPLSHWENQLKWNVRGQLFFVKTGARSILSFSHTKILPPKWLFTAWFCQDSYDKSKDLWTPCSALNRKVNICTKFSTHLKGFTKPLLVSLWDIFICLKLMKINCTAQNKYRKYGLYKGISSLFFHHS